MIPYLTAGPAHIWLKKNEYWAEIGLGRVIIDVFAEAGQYLGFGNLTVNALPDGNRSNSEVVIKLNVTTTEEVKRTAEGYGGTNMTWKLRLGIAAVEIKKYSLYDDRGSYKSWMAEAIRELEVPTVVNMPMLPVS